MLSLQKKIKSQKERVLIHKILIANRGEIAVRIIRACKDLHIKNVAIYTKPDQECLHVKVADEAYQIGIDPIKGYLDAKRIVEVAKACGADAIHPGYGFLSENYEFAKEVQDAGLIFIGPDADVIRKMGNKNIARYKSREYRNHTNLCRKNRLSSNLEGKWRRRRTRN